MSFFNKLKSAFGGKQEAPKYRQYQASELKVIAMKTRLILEQHRETLMQHITKEDQQFKYAGQDLKKVYDILQSIGQKVIEAQSLKILIEMVRKIESHTIQIINTHGDVSKLRAQIQWFQCVLWYRRSREITNLEDLYSFCYNFFKGVDITTELNVHCEVFQFYPIMKYLPKQEGFPLHELLPYIEPYVNHRIDPPVIESVVGMSKMQGGQTGPQHKSYVNPSPGPGNPPNPQHSSHQPSYHPPKHQSNYNPYQNSPYQSYNNSNVPPLPQPPNANYPQYPNAPNPNYSNVPNSNPYGYNPNQGQNQQSINPNSHPNYQQPFPPQPQQSQASSNTNPYETRTPESSPQKRPKQSFYGSLMKGPTPNYEREPHQRQNNEQYGSQVPFNRAAQEGFDDIDQTMKDLEDMEKKQSQLTQIKKREEAERIAREEEERRKAREEEEARKRREEEQRQLEEKRRQEEQERVRQTEQQRQREEAQRIEKERLSAERKLRQQEQQQQRLIDELKKQQQVLNQQQQEQDEALLRQAEQRFNLQDEEERKDKEQDEREREWEEEREQVERELEEREEELQINVFADDQREGLDRGMSGRFSNNFGMKVDFGDSYQGEEFNYNSGRDIQTSMLKFATTGEEEQNEFGSQPVKQPLPDLSQQDETDSLDIIRKHESCEPETSFKLFYFKRMELDH